MINNLDLKELQDLTGPFSTSGEHVQGPGGNTSVKVEENILIKASGYTFGDVKEGHGIVLLSNNEIRDNLNLKIKGKVDPSSPKVLFSTPENLRPSMEFEFHSLLKKYVLHTHSVYANVITCSTTCKDILSKLFDKEEYLLVPYVTPGTPIASYLLANTGTQNIPTVIFLKNHGIIVHGDHLADVVNTYNKVEKTIRDYLDLPLMHDITIRRNEVGDLVDSGEISKFCSDLANAGYLLTEEILIPDQSIFFKDKIYYSEPTAQCLFIDPHDNSITIIGSDKFRKAGKEMLLAVYYIRNQLTRLGFTPDYISSEKIAIMHNLDTEKYRANILKN